MVKVFRYKVIWAIVFFLSLAINAIGQNDYKLSYRFSDKDSLTKRQKLALKSSFPTFMQAAEYLKNLPAFMQAMGFIAASVDSVEQFEKISLVYLFAGEKYDALDIIIPSVYKPELQSAGVSFMNSRSKVSGFQQYQQAADKLLDFFERTGYPFAKVSLDSMVLYGNRISALLHVDKGFAYHIDSIRHYGPARISNNFLHHYLNMPRGSFYNKEKLDKINQRLLELPYLEQMQPWDITMLNTGSLVNLYLKPKRSNQVNVLAGFLPSNQQLGGKLLLTVDANLQLKNAFGGGESIGIRWQQIQPKSPRVNLSFIQPFIFNSPVGFDIGFQLFKKDSTFLNISGQIGLAYMISPTQTGRIILQTQKTNVLQIDTSIVKATKRLPDIADVSALNIGLDYELAATDYRFNPTRGNEVFLSISTGSRNIVRNNEILQLKDPNFDFNSLYDTLKLKSYQVRLKITAAHYFKTGKRTVLKTGINTGLFESVNYFRNEQFQIGGYRLLRGFDEESIFSNQYVVGTAEYRYLLSQNSNFFLFSDIGWSNNKITQQSNIFLGAGLGLSLETKGGIFNITYAVGKRNDLDFSLKQSKIHFGFVSIF